VDAFIPGQGDTIGHLAAAKPGSCLGNPAEDFNPVPYPGAPSGDVDLYIKPDLVPGCFATGLPAELTIMARHAGAASPTSGPGTCLLSPSRRP
jgi:hypothetical protein